LIMWLVVLVVCAIVVSLIFAGYLILQHNIRILNKIFASLNTVENEDFEELIQRYTI
jgi:hypothetical protein